MELLFWADYRRWELLSKPTSYISLVRKKKGVVEEADSVKGSQNDTRCLYECDQYERSKFIPVFVLIQPAVLYLVLE